ncbi:MAG: hypothetical protein LQ347_002964 [Umbilicaria vellea]|nr:MAG: hypothetical protein LQ347_002964 [Umbilicaria vellea]
MANSQLPQKTSSEDLKDQQRWEYSEDRCMRTLSSGRAAVQQMKRPMITGRPTTWHSSSLTPGLPGSISTFQTHANESMIDSRMSGYRTSEISVPSALATQVQIDSNVPLNPYGDPATSLELNDQSRIPFGDQQSFFFDASGTPYPTEPTDLIDYANFPHMAAFQEPLTYRQPRYPALDWTQVFPPELPWTAAYPVPQYPSTQAFPATLSAPSAPLQPRPGKEQTKELVGMGLYDSPDQDHVSSLLFGDDSGCRPFCGTLQPRHESVGKGLKLEETWQPPTGLDDEEEDEVEDEADEDCSTDEGEEELPYLIGAGEQQAVLPPYGNLSNRTFFFDDNDENFTNETAFDQNFSFAQHKTLEPTLDHATWI